MEQATLYDEDIVTWSERQGAALRGLATRPELSNAVDWENVAEEIESVGRVHIHAVEGHLVQLLAHLIKRLSAPNSSAQRKWREETIAFHSGASIRYERSMKPRIDLGKCWRLAKSEAKHGLDLYGDTILPHLPSECPFSIEDLLEAQLDVDAALMTIAGAAGAQRRK